jgi:hypothetical protein
VENVFFLSANAHNDIPITATYENGFAGGIAGVNEGLVERVFFLAPAPYRDIYDTNTPPELMVTHIFPIVGYGNNASIYSFFLQGEWYFIRNEATNENNPPWMNEPYNQGIIQGGGDPFTTGEFIGSSHDIWTQDRTVWPVVTDTDPNASLVTALFLSDYLDLKEEENDEFYDEEKDEDDDDDNGDDETEGEEPFELPEDADDYQYGGNENDDTYSSDIT